MIWKFYIEDVDEVQTEIPNPIGWADAELNILRDIDLHGIFFEYSLPLKFYSTGYALIKAEYDANGIEGFLKVVIQYQCAPGDAFDTFFEAKLNFTKIRFEESEICLVEAPIEDDSYLSMFKNRQDQKVDLDSLTSFDDVALDAYTTMKRTLQLTPKTILKTDKFGYDDTTLIDGDDVTATGITSSTTGAQTFTYFIWLKEPDIIDEIIGMNDDYENGFSQTDTDVLPIWTMPWLQGAGAYELDINYDIRLDVDVLLGSGTLDGCGINDRFSEVRISLMLGQIRGGTQIDLFVLDGDYFSGCFDSLFSEEINLGFTGAFPFFLFPVLPGDEFAISFKVEITGSYTQTSPTILIQVSSFIMEHGTSYFKVTTPTAYPATYASVYMVNEVLARCVESITNNNLTVYSDYFGRTDALPYSSDADGCGSLEVLTTGLKIRRDANATVTWSFKEVFEGLNAIHNIGMGLEEDDNKAGFQFVRIEPSDYFYSSDIIMTCDKVQAIIRRIITDEHYSIFEFGYSKWEAEEYNGLDEFATKRSYRTSLQSVKNTLTRISNFIASGYAIEVTRQQYSSTSKDWRYDNDIFIICVDRDSGDIIVQQGNILSANNIIDPDSVYNWRISPNRNALRWLRKILASYNEPAGSDGIIFMSGDGNTLADGGLDGDCVMDAGVLSEQEPAITIDSLATPADGLPLYELESWEFDYPLSVAEYLTIKANPRGLVRVRAGQNTDFTDCYIRKIAYKPNQGIASFLLMPKLYDCADGIGCWIIETDFEVQ